MLRVLVPLMIFFAGPPDAAAEDFEQRIWRGDFSDARAGSGVLKLLSWNIERGLQFPRVLAAIESAKPDLCLLQEVDLNARRTGRKNLAEEIARRLRLNYVFAAEYHELGQGDRSSPAYHGQAVLSSLPIRSARFIRFSEQSRFWAPKWYLPNWGVFQRRVGGRLALVAEADFHGATLVLYDVHLESRGPEERRKQQIEDVLADARRYPMTTPIVIAGDFNTRARSSPVTAALTQAGFKSTIIRETITTKRGAVLDWIFVRNPLTFREGTVHSGVHASDHYSLTVILGTDTTSPK